MSMMQRRLELHRAYVAAGVSLYGDEATHLQMMELEWLNEGEGSPHAVVAAIMRQRDEEDRRHDELDAAARAAGLVRFDVSPATEDAQVMHYDWITYGTGSAAGVVEAYRSAQGGGQ